MVLRNCWGLIALNCVSCMISLEAVESTETFALREVVVIELILQFCNQKVALEGEVVHIVPPAMGRAVLAAAHEPKQLAAFPDADHTEGTQIGKRYVNEAGDLEVLCTKPGEGSLSVDGVALTIKGAKPLPSSD